MTENGKIICQGCNNQIDASSAFCPVCGRQISNNTVPNNQQANNYAPETAHKKGRSTIIPKILVCVIVAVVICAIGGYAYETIQYNNLLEKEAEEEENLEENVKNHITYNLIFRAIAKYGGNQSYVDFTTFDIYGTTVVSSGKIYGYDENGDSYKALFYREDTIADTNTGSINSADCIYIDWDNEMTAGEVRAAAISLKD